MDSKTKELLLALNRRFYAEFASPFAESRSTPQPGFNLLLPYIPENCQQAADIGCGNGRFGHVLAQVQPACQYTGIDFSSELLSYAADSLAGRFLERDISKPGFMSHLGQFDLIICLATLQHIPGREERLEMLREMTRHLAQDGRIFLSNWQFAHSPRQRRKIASWEEVGLSESAVEKNDFLLTWQRNGRGLRYVHLLEESEISWLADQSGLSVMDMFRSDGREGDLNLYSILMRGELG